MHEMFSAPLWIPPLIGIVKFNVVGASKVEVAVCGGVLRTSYGDVNALFSEVVADKSKKTRSRSRSRDVVATLDKRVDELLASVKDVQGVCRRDTCP
ncbi:hypothetical protein V6N13_098649 [Hibiscus sabdariffa]